MHRSALRCSRPGTDTYRVRRLLTILVAICNVALMSGQQPPAPTGVLVGVHRYPDSASTPVAAATLRTLWLESGGRVANAGGLLLPRRTGFWWLDLDRSCTEGPVVDFNDQETGEYEVEVADDLRASPVETRPAATPSSPCVERRVHCVTDRRIWIWWVWPDLVSMNRGGESGCGAHPDGWFKYSVERIDELGRPLTASTVFGDTAGRRLQEAFDRAERARREEDPMCADLAKFSPESWRIERTHGGWKVEGWSDTHRLCGAGIDYTIDADLSRLTRGQPPPPPTWTTVAGATDAMSSPGGQWVLVVSGSEVRLSSRDQLGRAVSRLPISKDDSIVMVEWATGPAVARWREQVGRLARPRR
jgi:hypothetical protein